MNTKFDVSLMVKVAQMYYENGLKQEEIASQLQISRSMISMILTEAKEVGIIETRIRNPLLNNSEISGHLKSHFSLQDCIVVPTAIHDVSILRKLVAQRAVDVFNGRLSDGCTVGVTWGRTCCQFITAYTPNRDFRDVNVVSLIGGSNQTAHYFQLNEMVRVMAEKLKGVPYFMHAPALASSEEEKDLYLKSASVKVVSDKWKNIDVLVAGIGTLPDEKGTQRETYIGEIEIFNRLKGKEAVGDICARYFNAAGEFVKDELYGRIIGVTAEDLMSAKTVIAIAAGTEKANAIAGALYAGIVDVFITDEQTANAVLGILKK